MASPLAASRSTVTSVSLAISLAGVESSSTGLQTLASATKRLELPATWIVDQPRQAKVLAAAAPSAEVAAAVTARSPQRLRTELSNLQVGIEALTAQPVAVVAGDPQQLRARASLLDDLGIVAIVSDASSSEEGKPPRQLPCGLWQLDATFSLPRSRSRWSFMPTRRASLERLVAQPTGGSTILSIDLGQASTRDVQQFTKLMEEAAQASRQQQVKLVSLSQLATQLAHQHEVKPQRSILRRAA